MKEKTLQIQENITEIQNQGHVLRFISAMHSDIGIARKVNQDACCVRMMKMDGHFLVLAAVCDGVGGLQEGDYASKSTIQCLNHWFDYVVGKKIREKDSEQLIEHLRREIEECIQKQNCLIHEYASDKGIRTGTTLTLLLIVDKKYVTAQIGDSRAYHIGNELRQLTVDQSVVECEIQAGRLTREEARYDKRRNIILQCIGASEKLQTVYKSGNLKTGDVFLLCSDGFVHELEEDEIRGLLEPELLINQFAVKKCLLDAVSLVKKRGEKDNITVVVVKAEG